MESGELRQVGWGDDMLESAYWLHNVWHNYVPAMHAYCPTHNLIRVTFPRWSS